MSDNPRIEDLRRRVQKDPASIAFAQLAEEYRRAGHYEEAIKTCRAGLARHPGYLSARVTLGRSLIETGDLDGGQTELEFVLRTAPENLAAIRGLADIHHRRGELADALSHYRAALALAHNDPDLEQTVEDMARELEPARKGNEPLSSSDGPVDATQSVAALAPEPSGIMGPEELEQLFDLPIVASPARRSAPQAERAEQPQALGASLVLAPALSTPVAATTSSQEPPQPGGRPASQEYQDAISELERWLSAIALGK